MDGSFVQFGQQPMDYPEALAGGRVLLAQLRTPVYRDGSWELTEVPLLDASFACHWTEHSERHTLPRWAACMGYGKSDRDMLGRWLASGSDGYLADARATVVRVQTSVAAALRSRSPALMQEEDLLDTLKRQMTSRGYPEGAVAEHVIRLATLMPPSAEEGEDARKADSSSSDGFGPSKGSSSDEEEKTPAYWMADKRLVLHCTKSTSCTWNPGRLRSSVIWFSTLEEATDRATSKCKRCFDSNHVDGSSGATESDTS